MGNKESKLVPVQLGNLEDKIKGLMADIQSIQGNVGELSNEYLMKSELDSKIQKVEENAASASEKLTQLLEITKDQQQVIIELGAQYSQLCDSYQCQQQALELITNKCEERLSKYEDELQAAKNKLGEMEKGVIENSEFTKTLGIRRTENMIKKESISPLRKKNTTIVALRKNLEETSKGKDKVLLTRSQKRNEKDLTPENVKNSSRYKENEASLDHGVKLNFLEIIMNEKQEQISQLKESLTEVDINTLH